ncbi:unnamed protein product [Larinioides sclopetarius]|uniref:Uncharacterized protein n=1 Tax=Larinioides sclopetarius TaxID=280406 RepID=A0AAV2AYK7_9ARAC
MVKLLWPSVFTVFMTLPVPPANGFERNPTNPGSGMNFYGEILDTSVLRRPEVLIFGPSDCSG